MAFVRENHVKRTLYCCGVVGLILIMLSGCTSLTPSTNSSTTSTSTGSVPAMEPADSGTANADTTTVMGQITTDVSGSMMGTEIGGTMTFILRAVEVSEQRTVIKFALRWDDSDIPDGERHNLFEFSDIDRILVVDKNTLTGYRPFCTKGSWKAPDISNPIYCENSQLVVPDFSTGYIANHALIEGYAYLPVPSGKPATLDVNIGLASFTDATVSYK